MTGGATCDDTPRWPFVRYIRDTSSIPHTRTRGLAAHLIEARSLCEVTLASVAVAAPPSLCSISPLCALSVLRLSLWSLVRPSQPHDARAPRAPQVEGGTPSRRATLEVDRLVVGGHGGLLEGLRHGGVRVARAADVLRARAVLHGEHALRDHLARVGRDDVDAWADIGEI